MKVRAWVASGLVLACGARTEFFDVPAVEVPGSVADGGSDGAAEAGKAVGCQDGQFTLHRASPTVMFVLDRSQSMREVLEDGNSKWSILTSSLTATLPPVDNTMAIGGLIFPVATGSANSCVAPSTADLLPALGNANALVQLLQNTGPHGSTPTADAIDNAATALVGVRAATTARAMVLATDGEPTCNASLEGNTCRCVDGRCGGDPERCLDDVRTTDRLGTHRDQGIPTYVIGIQDADDTELVEVLDAMAIAGGRPKLGEHGYYAASSASELTLAISTIRDQVAACTYLTSSVPGAEGTILLSVNGEAIPEGTSWSWASRTNGEILLGSTACGAASADSSSVVVQVRCEPPEAGADASDGGDADAADADTGRDD